jgi:hypothetical protein
LKKVKRAQHRGVIEIKLFMERGQEWDWHVFDYQFREEQRIVKEKDIKKLSRRYKGTEEAPISFPLRITLSNLSLFDLKEVHVVGSIKPYLLFDCGSIVGME